MKPRIFIAIHYMHLGGAETSLLGLLQALDTSKVDVDLFVYSHEGELMKHIPEGINLLPENQIWSMSIIFGSYLGETLLKNGLIEKGFAWGKEKSSNIPLLIKDNGCYITPNDKVYKRLVNGSVDSIISFYQFATNEISL